MQQATSANRDEKSKSLGDYLEIFRRRKHLILGVGGLVFGLALATAFLLSPKYRSTATILIEEQEIPADLVHSSITSYADQRIEIVKQQVMIRSTLWKVIEQYNLYKGMRRDVATEDVIQRFVKDISIEVINADVIDKRTQHPTKATIAFTLSYDGETPELAQKVANELTSLFLSENLRSRERQAQGATAFLKQEADDLAKHIEEVEGKISAFKQRANGALPELMPLNLQLMNQTDRELMDQDQQIRSLEERKTYLEGELATIKPHTPMISATGERILDSHERLKALRAQYASSAASLSGEHPDIVKMKQEIEALEKETGQAPDAGEFFKRLMESRATLAKLMKRYGPDHPDVAKTRATITALESELRRLPKEPKHTVYAKPENPAYINIQSQLRSVTSSLEALRMSRAAAKQRVRQYAERLERTPQLEPGYLELTRDRDTSSHKYQDIRSRLLEAKVSEELETQRKGERFSLAEPPELPLKPHKPNRLAIILLGFILSLAGGTGAGAIAENMNQAIRTPEQLAAVTLSFPLAVIPFMPNEDDLGRAVRHRRLLKSAGIGAVLTILLLIHVFVLPLDVLWYVALKRFGIE